MYYPGTWLEKLKRSSKSLSQDLPPPSNRSLGHYVSLPGALQCRAPVRRGTKFCMVTRNICGSPVRDLLHVTFLAPIMFKWLPHLLKKKSWALLHATELADTIAVSAKFSALFILANQRSIHDRYDVELSDGQERLWRVNRELWQPTISLPIITLTWKCWEKSIYIIRDRMSQNSMLGSVFAEFCQRACKRKIFFCLLLNPVVLLQLVNILG